MGLHTFRRHASPPQAPAYVVHRTLVRSPREDFFSKIIWPNISFGPSKGSLCSGLRNAHKCRAKVDHDLSFLFGCDRALKDTVEILEVSRVQVGTFLASLECSFFRVLKRSLGPRQKTVLKKALKRVLGPRLFWLV